MNTECKYAGKTAEHTENFFVIFLNSTKMKLETNIQNQMLYDKYYRGVGARWACSHVHTNSFHIMSVNMDMFPPFFIN